MNETFIQNWKAAMPQLRSANPVERAKATTQTIQKNAAIDRKNQESVVNNTFKTDDNGTRYGVGTDGKTYSYNTWNNKVVDMRPLTSAEQRDAISRFSGGNISVDNRIKNNESLTNILQSVVRLYDQGGSLVPGPTNITDLYEGGVYSTWGPLGETTVPKRATTKTEPVLIKFKGLSVPWAVQDDIDTSSRSGWSSSEKHTNEHVPTHELAHATQASSMSKLQNWYNAQAKEAEKYKGKLPATALWAKTTSGLTGIDYPESTTVEEKIKDRAQDKMQQWQNELKEKYGVFGINGLFKIAAKNAGFESVDEAAKTVSRYASSSLSGLDADRGRYPEVFAEAYTDVLLDGDDAKPFSKELIRLFSDYAADMDTKTGETAKKRVSEMRKLLNALPEFSTNNSLTVPEKVNAFTRNYRLTSNR